LERLYEGGVRGCTARGEVVVEEGTGRGGVEEIGYPLVSVNECLQKWEEKNAHCSRLWWYIQGMPGCQLDSRLRVWHQ